MINKIKNIVTLYLKRQTLKKIIRKRIIILTWMKFELLYIMKFLTYKIYLNNNENSYIRLG